MRGTFVVRNMYKYLCTNSYTYTHTNGPLDLDPTWDGYSLPHILANNILNFLL